MEHVDLLICFLIILAGLFLILCGIFETEEEMYSFSIARNKQKLLAQPQGPHFQIDPEFFKKIIF